MKARAHIIITGRVTGIFFRSHLRNKARIKNVSGWVRNLKEGQVEAVLEGDKDQITDVIDFCREGPPNASVGDVTIEWTEFSGNFADFEIRF